jgi:hypothetical protein
MRFWLILFLILSVGLTRATFAMPLMSADMRTPDCVMVTDGSQSHDAAMHESHITKPATKAGHPHCLCVMCFPAIASAAAPQIKPVSSPMPIPHNRAMPLPDGPEPAFPPPRLG